MENGKDKESGGSQMYEDAYIRALAYASRKLRGFRHFSLTAEDVTHMAIEKTLSGERPWDRNQYPDLFVHLAGCIKSIISNTYTSADYKSSLHQADIVETADIIPSHELTPEEHAEQVSWVNFLISYITKKKPELLELIRTIYLESITKPQELAKILNMTVEEINSKKLTIKRLFSSSNFLLDYISENRKDLLETANIILKKNIKDDHEIALAMGIDVNEAKRLRTEVINLAGQIKEGEI